MNINSLTTALPMATVVNPPTDSLRRENNTRELIAQPSAAAQSAAEKGVASDKERAKTPAQQNEQVDFTSLRKQAEQDDATIGDSNRETSGQESNQQNSKQQEPEQQNAEHNSSESSSSDHRGTEQEHHAQSEHSAEEQILKALSARDAEVKRHENAHASVGGSVTGAPSYQYQIGPDGKRYAVGGEVSVDLSPVSGDPSATIVKMQKVQAAALAPMNPSIQDTKVAASAAKLILEAQTELLALDAQKRQLSSENRSTQHETATVKSSSSDFDTFINQTLEAQDTVSTERSNDVLARAGRIEHFYGEINQAYEKPSKSHFQLTA